MIYRSTITYRSGTATITLPVVIEGDKMADIFRSFNELANHLIDKYDADKITYLTPDEWYPIEGEESMCFQ